MSNIKRIIQWLSFVFYLSLSTTWADVIKNYHMNIKILEDGQIDVIETIEMDVDHQDIRLGIIRNIPRYYYIHKQKVDTPITILSVTRNGQTENFWTESEHDNIKLLTGATQNSSRNYIPTGINIYKIHWRSDNHIRGFMDYDELYLNAIGTDWQFPIEKASATIYLPESVSAIQSASYYGERGSQRSAEIKKRTPHTIEFSAPHPIGNGQGLTVAIGFTPNIIPSVEMGMVPRVIEKILNYFPPFVQAVHLVLITLVFLALIYWYFCLVIYRRITPKSSRAFMVRFSPPSMSLDLLMALSDKEYSDSIDRFNTAFLVDMASKGALCFDQDAKFFEIMPLDHQELTDGQREFLQYLNENTAGKVSYNVYNAPLSYALSKMVSTVIEQGQKIYFSPMTLFKRFGIVLLLACIFFSTEIISGATYAALVFPLIGTVILCKVLYAVWTRLSATENSSFISNIFEGLLLLLLGAVMGFLPLFLMWGEMIGGEPSILSVISVLILLALFLFIIKQFDRLSQCVKAEYVDEQQSVLEFKHFLQYTKEAEYKLITPELFEEYLPYAIIFGVDRSWVKLYERLYPDEYTVSLRTDSLVAYGIGVSTAFTAAMASPTSNRSGGISSGSGGSRGSGSGGGGSSGGGSGGGGGSGR